MIGKSYLSIILATLISLLLITAKASGATWTIEAVDSGGDVGEYTSIALDSSGKVHMSYRDSTNGNLKYATNASGSWVTETVDSGGDVGEYASIALDSSGKVHISYYDTINEDLKYATNASGSWVTETVDSSEDVGWNGTSIALDSSGKVHISYYDFINLALKYATNASGSWVTETVDSGGDVGEYASIALDTSDKVHISYYDYDNDDLKYAKNASGSWVTETVDSGGNVGVSTSIAVDILGRVHISYYDATNGDLKYAYAGTNPLPDIKANGTDGPVTLGPGDTLSVSISLTAGAMLSNDADWWVVLYTPFAPPDDWFHLDLNSGWTSGLSFTYQGQLFDLGTSPIFDMDILPAGTYTFYFAVDTNMNGVLDLDIGTLFFDSVTVTVVAP